MGRVFRPEEQQTGDHPAVVITARLCLQTLTE